MRLNRIRAREEKSILNEITTLVIIVLVCSVMFGLTFLFTTSLKSTARTNTEATYTITNESGAYLNISGYTLGIARNDTLSRNFAITAFYADNSISPYLVPASNYTISAAGVLTNASVVPNSTQYEDAVVSYTYLSAKDSISWNALNDTEAAGATLVDYLPLLFLSIIFGIIMAVVLKVILPYVNLGRQMNGF